MVAHPLEVSTCQDQDAGFSSAEADTDHASLKASIERHPRPRERGNLGAFVPSRPGNAYAFEPPYPPAGSHPVRYLILTLT